MYPSRFRYLRPDTFPEALALLEEHGDEARPLAGGQSLIPLMKLRMVHPAVVIDLNRLPELDRIRIEGDEAVLGALVRHWQVEESDLVGSRLPVLQQAASILGDVQVRSLGTVAGAAAEADPSGDWGTGLLATGAEIVCTSREGDRVVPIGEFFSGYLESDVRPNELIRELRVPLTAQERSGGAYAKLERRAGDFAVVSAAVQLTLDDDGMCTDVGIGLAGVGPTPMKAVQAEAVLRGSIPDASVIEQARESIRETVSPIDDGRGPAWYKRDMVGVFFERALAEALAHAQDGADNTSTAGGEE